jgi:predicted GNAT family acetyltransferase
MHLDEIRFEHDTETQNFYAFLPEGKAVMEYKANREGKIFVTHTEVDPALRGKGVGDRLALHVLDYIRNNKFKLVPLCPFMVAYLKRHTEHMDLVAAGINIR